MYIRETIRCIEETDLPGTDRAQIFRGNAIRLMGLNA